GRAVDAWNRDGETTLAFCVIVGGEVDRLVAVVNELADRAERSAESAAADAVALVDVENQGAAVDRVRIGRVGGSKMAQSLVAVADIEVSADDDSAGRAGRRENLARRQPLRRAQGGLHLRMSGRRRLEDG